MSENQPPSAQTTESDKYFPDFSFQDENPYKQKADSLWLKFRYQAQKAWPFIKNFLTFLFYWAFRAIRSIASTAKDQVGLFKKEGNGS